MKQKIETIFIDMGNTLLDFHQGPSDDEKEKLGLVEMAKYLSQFSEKEICEKELEYEFLTPWLSYIGPRRKEHLKEYPIEDFLVPFLLKRGISLDKSQMVEALDQQNLIYRQHLVMEDDLIKTLSELKEKGIKLGVISNSCNYDEVNLAHFEKMGIKKFFDSFTFSYYLGDRKPRPEIFNAAIKNTNACIATSVMVGDSLKADIQGAQKMGLRAVWYNPGSTENSTTIIPDFEIKKLDELQWLERGGEI